MADKSKPNPKVQSGLTRPGELYVHGDALPVPEMEEKNTDSIWALWSDLAEEKPQAAAQAPDDTNQDRDFLATVPLDIRAPAENQGTGASSTSKAQGK